jgi:hypothetical protein
LGGLRGHQSDRSFRILTAPEQRPGHDTIDNIIDWLLGSPRQLSDGIASFDEFAWRLLAAQMPLLRVTLHTPTHSAVPPTLLLWSRL